MEYKLIKLPEGDEVMIELREYTSIHDYLVNAVGEEFILVSEYDHVFPIVIEKRVFKRIRLSEGVAIDDPILSDYIGTQLINNKMVALFEL